MKLLAFLFFMLMTFSVFANCEAPIELVLSLDENTPGQVILKYSERAEKKRPSGLIYRAKNDNGTWIDIHQFQIEDAENDDKFFIAAEECVPAGEWTYIIPVYCDGFACYCKNFGSLKVPEYEYNCINSSQAANISSKEFEEKMMEVYWTDPEADDYGNDDEIIQPDSDAVEIFDGDISDSQIDSDDTEPVETKDDEQAIDIDQPSDVDKTNDEDVKETIESGKSDGCSILVF